MKSTNMHLLQSLSRYVTVATLEKIYRLKYSFASRLFLLYSHLNYNRKACVLFLVLLCERVCLSLVCIIIVYIQVCISELLNIIKTFNLLHPYLYCVYYFMKQTKALFGVLYLFNFGVHAFRPVSSEFGMFNTRGMYRKRDPLCMNSAVKLETVLIKFSN